jgi:hypothetical protein
MGSSIRQAMPRESERRLVDARGTLILLANGEDWLFSPLQFSMTIDGLTSPRVDEEINSIFDGITIDGRVKLADIWTIARLLLNTNYTLTDDEVGGLFEFRTGSESQDFSDKILSHILFLNPKARGLIDWVRASLIANRIDPCLLNLADLTNVLEILVTTNRTIPLSKFADACQHSQERDLLDSLV